MAYDFKKEQKELYLPLRKPVIVTVPPMAYMAVRGEGDPNAEDGQYKASLEMLYGIAYTLKMSKKGTRKIEGYFDFVVPPPEGFWWQEDHGGVDFSRKDGFSWLSVMRLPDFVDDDDFAWAVAAASAKKGGDFSAVELLAVDEGLCVQCMHVGSYDDEPATVDAMHAFAESEGYAPDFSEDRRHHEIYLSDPRRTAPEKMRTVVRHPIRKI